MINNISNLFKQPEDKQKEFFYNCEVEEKIAAYKFSVKIINLTNYKFYKGSKEITQDLVILNKIWETLIKDWTVYFINNPDIVKKYIGCIFYGFYFPDKSPLNESFKYNINGKKYLIHSLVNWKKKDCFEKLESSDLYEVQERFSLKNYTINNYSDLINILNSFKKYAEGNVYGWVLKYKKEKYQIQTIDAVHYDSNKVPLELMMIDFIDYLNKTEYDNFITDNYVLSICNLFEDYILNKNCHLETKYKLVDSDLEAPYYGKYFGMSYNYIPSEKTRALCIQNKLYENVFKIMLANFKRYKDFSGSAILNKKKIYQLNSFIKYIKMKCKV